MPNKENIRETLLQRRMELDQESYEKTSLVVQERLIKSPVWPKSGRVALYYPVKNEVRTFTLFQQAIEKGLHVYFPRVEQGIRFYEVNGPEDLQKGSWGIMEPKGQCRPLAEDQGFDLLVLPGIAFTKDGYRIGYGKGFYDKFLAELNHKPKAVALAFDFQVVDAMPMDEWDEPLSGIMTEKHFFSRDG